MVSHNGWLLENDSALLERHSGGESIMANQVGKRYRCEKCGTELIVTRPGDGQVKCCGQPMVLKT